MNDKFVRGLAVGAAAAVVALIYGPAIAKAAKPALRKGMKSALVAYMRGREMAAEFVELAEDAYAEAWSDLKEQAETAAETVQAEAASKPVKDKVRVETRSKKARG